MGNTVSAHICQIKVFRPYPVILYELRLDHSIHWWKKIGVPRNDQIWRTRWWGIYTCMTKSPIEINGEILFLLISAKLRSLEPTLLYCIDSNWTTLSIGGKKNWCPSEQPNLAYSMVRHLPMYDKIPNWNQWEILFLLISAKLRSLDPTLLYCMNSDWTTLSIGGKKLVSLGTTKFGVLDGEASTHVWQNPQLK